MEDTGNFMASQESEKLTELYRYWGDRRAASNEGIPLIRDFYADYHQLATEAEGVSYATVKDGPVPGIWAIPAGAAARDTVSSLPMWPRPQACGRWSSTTGWLRNTACRPSSRTAGRHSTGWWSWAMPGPAASCANTSAYAEPIATRIHQRRNRLQESRNP